MVSTIAMEIEPMRLLITCIALLLTILGGPAHAACWPGVTTVGTVASSIAEGRYVGGWAIGTDGDYAFCLVASRNDYALRHPAIATGLTPSEIAAAYWQANVAGDCSSGTADRVLLAVCDAAYFAGAGTRPPPPHAVRPNGTYLTRPTYPVLAGVRSKTSNGSVPIKDATGRATACDPAETLREGSSIYRRVKATPGTVALCT